MSDPQQDEQSAIQPQMPNRKNWTTVAFWLSLAGVILTACFGLTFFFSEPEMVSVTGRVLYQGKTLPDGFVISSPVRGGESALSALDSEGGFNLSTNGTPGAAVGTHRFMIRAYTREMPPVPIIPGMYTSPQTTPLTIVVKQGARNHFEFFLEKTKTE